MPPGPVGIARRILAEDRRAVLHAVLAPLALAAGLAHAAGLSYQPPRNDGVHYVTYAYNLLHHGTYSRGRVAPPRPDHYREPLWPALLAAGMWLHPGIDAKRDSGACLWHGEGEGCTARASQLKLANVGLLVAAAWLAGAAAHALTGRVAAGVVGFALTASSLSLATEADRFYSEVAGAALVTALSLALLRAGRARPAPRAWAALGVGALTGALCLAKAIFTPLLAGVPAVLGLLARGRGAEWSRAARLAGAALAGGLAVAGPWMARNAWVVGTPAISGRQHNLLFRAELSELPLSAWDDAFLYFTPGILALKDAQDTLERSGRVRLLDDDDPRGAYRRGHERLRALKREAAQAGVDWDALARRRALEQILDNPVGYAAMSLPLAWRGLFAEEGWGYAPARDAPLWAERALGWRPPRLLPLPAINEVQVLGSLGLFGSFAALGVAGLVRRRPDWLLFVLPVAFGYAMYVAVSHMWTRFAVPFLPVWGACAAWAAWSLAARVRRVPGGGGSRPDRAGSGRGLRDPGAG